MKPPKIVVGIIQEDIENPLCWSSLHPKVVQERLGHSAIGITLGIYSHVMPTVQAEAVSRYDAAVSGVS